MPIASQFSRPVTRPVVLKSNNGRRTISPPRQPASGFRTIRVKVSPFDQWRFLIRVPLYRIANYRGDHKHSGYARYTVEKAQVEIEREGRAANCGPDDKAAPESEIATDRMEIP